MLIGKLPIKKITLYQHGVAYVERRAVFNSGEPLSLSFEDKEMNDVLKSLCVFDMGRGKVTGVSYETAEDLKAQISKKAIKVPPGDAVFGLLEAARGYNVNIKLAGTGGGAERGKGSGGAEGSGIERTDVKEISGRLLGLERDTGSAFDLPEEGSDGEDAEVATEGVERPLHVVLVDGSDRFRSIPLESVSSLRLNDPFARSDLEYFLDASQSLRKGKYKRMTVYLEGDEHDLSIGYLTTMPAWRVSYRLLYAPEGPRLQGWGIVENQLDEDLDRVKFTLVSGMPISFIYEIYSPSKIERPYVHEDRAGMDIPVKFQEDPDLDYSTSPPKVTGAPAPEYHRGPGYDEGLKETEYEDEEIDEEMALTKGSELTTMIDSEKVDLGEQFRYEIDKPVSINRGNSALVPLFDSPADCYKEHLYNEDTTGKNPLVCMLLKNDLGNILDRGPITVIDDGKYSGEAILPFTTYDAENRIAYATDQALECGVEKENEEEIKGFEREDRNLKVESWLIEEFTYEIENSKDEDVTMVLEHPKSKDHDVFDTPDMLEETESFQRWRFKAGADKKTVFEVKQRKTVQAVKDIKTLPGKLFGKYVESGKMDEELKEFCREIMEMWKNIREDNERINKLNRHISALEADIQRLRTNMSGLSSSKRFKHLRNKDLKEDLDGSELVELNAEKARNPKEHELHDLYSRAVGEHKKRVTRRRGGIEFLRKRNSRLTDLIEFRFGKRTEGQVRKGPEQDISEDVEKMLAEDLVKYLIDPIQPGGV